MNFASYSTTIKCEVSIDVALSHRGLLELPGAEDLTLEGVLDLGQLVGGRHRLREDCFGKGKPGRSERVELY